MTSLLRNAARFIPALAVVGFCTSAVWANEKSSSPQTAEMLSYTSPDGESYFALSLKMADQPAKQVPRDHVILFDTSASQNGQFRQRALDVLTSLTESMSAEDRVCLYAVDVLTKRYTEEFISPAGREMESALQRLSIRTPLGATNMELAVRTGLQAVSGQRPASIIYIGDGLSIADLIGTETMRSLLGEMRDQQIAMHSFAIGPKTDLRLLGVMAQHSGGVVLIDNPQLGEESELYPQKVGQSLANAASAPIYYPQRYELTPKVSSIYPTELPPLRSDRETILIGKGELSDSPQISVTLGDRQTSWKISADVKQAGNTFLANVWAQADRDQGLSVPFAGVDMLNLAREGHENHVAQLVDMGEHAVASGQLKQADQFAGEIQRLDPANVNAKIIFATVAKKQQQQRVLKVAMQNQNNDAAQDEGTRDLVADERARRTVRAQRLKSEVGAALERANDARLTDPGAAIEDLKSVLRSVSASTDVDVDVREALRSRLRTAVQQLTILKDKREIEVRNAQQKDAAWRAQRRLMAELAEDEDTMKQLIDQVSVLIFEGFRGDRDAFEKAESVARAAFELAPYTGITAQAVFTTEAAGQLDKALRLRYLRYDRFLETLYQVELSHVPFPDEPPIVYPPADVWNALTVNREKWASVDLKKFSPIEERIFKALDDQTSVDFADSPLTEVVDYLKDLHNIEIVIDEAALNDEGISTDSPITLQLAGISLKNALKLMLEPLQLTYVVEDEVMKITTTIKAEESLQIRVYPVGDLVIPIQSIGGGLGGGGFGGGGFGGGGFGGGGFGGGGGGFGGGGFGGGGGGFFAVPAEDVPADFDNQAVKNGKKKQ